MSVPKTLRNQAQALAERYRKAVEDKTFAREYPQIESDTLALAKRIREAGCDPGIIYDLRRKELERLESVA